MPTIPSKIKPQGVAIGEPELVELDTDILLVGGGMGNCGAAYEACSWIDR